MRSSHVAVLLCVCLLGSSPPAHSDDGANTANAQTSPGDQAHVLRAFDSQGQYVGPVIPIDQVTIGVALRANGTLILAPITRVKLNGEVSASQYEWASTLSSIAAPPTVDCRNLPVINALEVPGVLRPSFSVRSGTVATAYIASDTNSIPTPPNGQCTGEATPLPSWLAASTYTLTQHHPEPLVIHY